MAWWAIGPDLVLAMPPLKPLRGPQWLRIKKGRRRGLQEAEGASRPAKPA